ncbi:MAG: hypothetical protein RLZZ350_2335 [Verrucomicrobiota bacterium]|jgi:endonuclease/exonuclease/phosphatase family metal-dependent hydrolase
MDAPEKIPVKKPSRLVRLIRLGVLLGTLAYTVTLVGLLWSLEHCREDQWYFSPLLYLPPFGWLLPLALLVPAAVIFRPAMLLFHAGCALFVLLWFMHFYAPEEPQGLPEKIFTVLSANLGQRKFATLQNFLDASDADVMVFQESLVREKPFALNNPNYRVVHAGEFSCASRSGVTRSAVVPDLNFDGRPIAAWFELKYQGKPIVIYSVHMPTPRAYLQDLRGGGFIEEANRGGGIFSADVRAEYQYYWTNRFALMRGLLQVLTNDARPKIICGDFNTPDHGQLYALIAHEFVDSYATAGQGYGQTFPGDARTPIAGYRPWLRLDYQFCDDHWRPAACTVEPLKRAQHLGLVASYEFFESDKDEPTEKK